MSQTKERENLSIVVAGRKRTGKSTSANELALAYPEDKPVIIVNPNNAEPYQAHEWIHMDQVRKLKKGIVNIFDRDHEKMFDVLNRDFINGMVIVDEGTKMIGSNPSKPVRSLLIDHTNVNVDLVMVFHSFKDTPPFIRRNISHYIVHKTQDNITEDRKWYSREFVGFDKLEKAWNKVMASKNDYEKIEVPTLV